jgi:SAM-dependent methyltransferase
LVYGCVLDVGCGKKPYAHLFDCEKYVGLEIDSSENRRNKKADLFYDGRHIPAEDNSFDWVISSQVLEHVFNPDEFLAEICRVLKNGGGLLITVPFMWDEHEQPYDYARYSSFGIKYLLEKQDFVIAEQRKTASGIRAVFQLINAYLYKITLTKKSYVNLLLWFLLMSPFNILGEILYWFLPRNTGLYLDNIILARKEKV